MRVAPFLHWMHQLLLGTCIVFAQAPLHATEIDWLAIGDARGFIAPCGCDPHTDLGGIKRIATLLHREHLTHPAALILHLGNSISLLPEDARKNTFIQKALAELPLTASLYNEGELLHPEGLADLPYVLSNAKKKGVYQSMRRVSTYEIWGFTWAESIESQVETWAQFESAHHSEWEKTDPAIQRILLFSGPTSMLQAASHHPWALIVSANTNKYGDAIGDEERKDPARLVRLDHPFVRMVPLAGQGVLRGGRLTLNDTPSLASLLQPDASTQIKDTPRSPLERIEITWLDTQYEEASPAAALFAQYEKEEAEFFEQQREKKKREQAESPFAGSAACKGCHASAYGIWEHSKHAHAYGTLQDKNKHHISECVGCHVVGFSKPGGFISAEDTPHLAGVQCENCHGPRKAHSMNPTLKGEAATPCVACHKQPHSPAFSESTYWEKIHHGR